MRKLTSADQLGCIVHRFLQAGIGLERLVQGIQKPPRFFRRQLRTARGFLKGIETDVPREADGA